MLCGSAPRQQSPGTCCADGDGAPDAHQFVLMAIADSPPSASLALASLSSPALP